GRLSQSGYYLRVLLRRFTTPRVRMGRTGTRCLSFQADQQTEWRQRRRAHGGRYAGAWRRVADRRQHADERGNQVSDPVHVVACRALYWLAARPAAGRQRDPVARRSRRAGGRARGTAFVLQQLPRPYLPARQPAAVGPRPAGAIRAAAA